MERSYWFLNYTFFLQTNLARNQPRNNLQAANERPIEPITHSREGTSSSQRPTRTSSHRETPMTDPRHLSDLQDAVLNIRLKRRQLDSVLTTQLTAHPENEREEPLGHGNLSGVPPPPVSRTRFVDPENQRIGRTVDAWMRTLQPEIQACFLRSVPTMLANMKSKFLYF